MAKITKSPATGKSNGVGMLVDEAITSRRSVRGYLPDPVPLETIKHILDVAARAPSGTNIQPWQVSVVAGEAKETVTRAVLEERERGGGEQEYTYYPTKWREPYISRRRKVGWDLYGLVGVQKGDREGSWRQMGRNFTFFDAPVGLFFFLDKDLELGSWLDMGMYVQSVMVAARGQGLHTCPQAAWVGYHRVIKDVLGVTDDQALVCGMSMGYEDTGRIENSLVTEREPCDVYTRFLGF